MALTKFIPKEERQHQSTLINAMAQAVYGTVEDTAFTEEFVPPAGRVPAPKVPNFAGFLQRVPQCLWAVYSDDTQSEVVGFISIYQNEIGFGLNRKHARKRLMYKSWNEIKLDPCLYSSFPLSARTSKRNAAAIALLKKLGFEVKGETIFKGEDSWELELKGLMLWY